MADDPTNSNPRTHRGIAVQGWLSVIVWMSFGLLLETMMAYKSPRYLDDQQRRELFRLAHAHGALLGLVLVVAALWIRRAAKVSRPGLLALRVGAVLLPVGFAFAGVWHPEGDPGFAIWLVPAGALLLIFGLISIAWSGGTD